MSIDDEAQSLSNLPPYNPAFGGTAINFDPDMRAEREADLRAEQKRYADERQAEKDLQRRAAALEAALRLNAPGGVGSILQDARAIEAFLRGETNQ